MASDEEVNDAASRSKAPATHGLSSVDRALHEPALLAVMFKGSALPTLPDDIKVIVSRGMSFYGSPRRFAIIEQSAPGESTADEQLQTLIGVVQSLHDFSEEGPSFWPLQVRSVSEALVKAELGMFAEQGVKDSWCKSALWYVSRFLRIVPPSPQGEFFGHLTQRYGQDVTFCFAWNSHYTQALWALALYCVVWQIASIVIDDGEKGSFWECAKVGVLCWSALFVYSAWRRFPSVPHQPGLWIKRRKRVRIAWLKFIFIACPLVCLLLAAALAIPLLLTNLELYLTYDWAGCADVDPPCTGPAATKGFVGWLVSVGLSILFAICFLILQALLQPLASYIADLRNLTSENDHHVTEYVLRSMLNMLNKMCLTGSVAFAFAPQWEEPRHLSISELQREVDCSGDFLGSFGLVCMRKKLPYAERLSLLESMMQGPFVVSPFIAILIKVIVPKVAAGLSWFSDESLKGVKGFSWAAVVPRICAYIFAYDCHNVGGLQFIWRGWPFEQEDKGSDQDEELISNALWQGVRKPFKPIGNLLNAQNALIWMVCWAPFFPWGVLPTLVASVLQVNAMIVKLLYVKRQLPPDNGSCARAAQISFAIQALYTSIGWNLGLSMITYNEDLWKAGSALTAVKVSIVAWLLLSCLVHFIFLRLWDKSCAEAKVVAAAPAPVIPA